ncbi:MAG TPA: GGDEF domain-containing protein [Candidatus Xenobia bacterium]|jgi:diguanylate cyclase (GGDEF)-like protein
MTLREGARRALGVLLGPLILLSAAAGLAAWQADARLVEGLTLLSLTVAAALAWQFHSSRSLTGAVLLAGIAAAARFPPLSMTPDGRPPLLLPLCLGALVPLNLVVFALARDRGIGNVSGLTRLALVLAQGLAVVHEAQYPNQALATAAGGAVWPWVDAAVLAGCSLFMLLRVYLYGAPLDGGTVGLLAASGLALTTGSPVFVLAGGTSLALSLVQHSYSLAFLDELTGIPARRSLRQELAGLSGRYAIAMIDIDHFKNFNDTYGHDVGDQCLRLVASRLSRVTGGGRAFRYGGEEFTVLFPGKAAKDALEALEQLRRTIEENPMILRGPDRPRRKPMEVSTSKGSAQKVTVTVSIGVAERTDRLPEPEEVIKAADQALYRAKKKGRNQVCR